MEIILVSIMNSFISCLPHLVISRLNNFYSSIFPYKSYFLNFWSLFFFFSFKLSASGPSHFWNNVLRNRHKTSAETLWVHHICHTQPSCSFIPVKSCFFRSCEGSLTDATYLAVIVLSASKKPCYYLKGPTSSSYYLRS